MGITPEATSASIVSTTPSTNLVCMRGISKRFPGITANDGIDFDLRRGEVHALLGENGAGKTTLMNILYGLYQPDEGAIEVRGQRLTLHSPRDAIAHGIGMVHQTFRLIPTLNVAENVLLGLPSGRPLVDLDETARRISALCERYGMAIDPRLPVRQLSAGQQQSVEILKALFREVQVLILDEPTSVLTPYETEGLFSSLEQFAREGYGVVFISHKLGEVMRVSHRITVLRDGKVVGVVGASEVERTELARLMVGREVIFRLDKADVVPGAALLRAEGLCAKGDAGLPALRDVSLSVRKGEILGIAGVAGNGQTELAEALYGLRPITRGQILLKDERVTHLTPREAIRRGIAFIPEKAREVAVLPASSIEANTALKVHDDARFRRGVFLNEQAIAAWADSLMKAFDVRAADRRVPAGQLSGGNLHKLVLAEELGRNPDLIIAVNPTAGLDVGATEYVRRHLLDERSRGKAILLISSDLDEILGLSDRIAVMYRGAVQGVVLPGDAAAATMGLLMAGLMPEDRAAIQETALVDSHSETPHPGWATPAVGLSEAIKVAGASRLGSRAQKAMMHLLVDRNAWVSLATSLAAIVAAFVIVGGLIAVLGFDPLKAYQTMWRGALGTWNGVGETLVRATPLLLAGLAIVVAFRSGIWNIGAEGQIYMGALGATLAGLAFQSLPAVVHLPLVIAGGIAFGAAYGALPGLMRAYRGVNEIITTIMFNYLAIFLVSWLVSGPLQDASQDHPLPQSPALPASALLPKLIAGTRAHAGIVLAVIAAGAVYVLLWKMVVGYRIRAVGENVNAARFGGIQVPRNIALAMAISGALAGLAGMAEVAGLRGALTSTFSPGYGFTAIAVALFGGLHPGPVVFAAFFFAALMVGADGLQRTMGVPAATVLIIQGLVLVFVIGRRVAGRRLRASKARVTRP